MEVGNVRLAAERIDAGAVARLEALLADLRGAVADADRFSTLDIAFHDVVCEAAGNFLLAQFMGIINTLGKVSRERTGAERPTRELALGTTTRSSRRSGPRDPDAAAAAMTAHLDHVRGARRVAERARDGSA